MKKPKKFYKSKACLRRSVMISGRPFYDTEWKALKKRTIIDISFGKKWDDNIINKKNFPEYNI